MTIHRALLCTCAAAAMSVGCAGTLPTYPALGDAESLTVIADRQASITSLTARCDLDLVDAQGQQVTLDAVLVAEPPGRVRLRAWKFGRAVMDLTLADGRAWVLAPDRAPGAGDDAVARGGLDRVPTRGVGEAMALLGPAFFRDATPVGGDAVVLRVRGPALGGNDVHCDIDRRTLTPRRFIVAASETFESEVLLDRYEVVDGIAWPMRIRLLGPTGQITIRAREIELNAGVPAAAFVPPRNATPLP